MAMWQVCGRWCRCVLALVLFITHHAAHIFAISLLCVTVMRVGRPEVFCDLFSSLSPPLSTPYFSSLWIDQNKALSCICGTKYVSSPLPDGCCCLDSALNCWDDKFTSTISFCKGLTDRERERKRETERDQPDFNISSQMRVWQMTWRSCRHRAPAAAASPSSVNPVH